MSFMFKPLAYDDPRAVNRIALEQKTVDQITAGNEAVEKEIAAFSLMRWYQRWPNSWKRPVVCAV